MASELTATTSANVTEFSGKYKLIYAQVGGSTNTDDYYEIDDVDTVDMVVTSLDEADADSTGVEADVDGTTSNRINIRIIESDGTVCTQNPTNVNIIAVGH